MSAWVAQPVEASCEEQSHRSLRLVSWLAILVLAPVLSLMILAGGAAHRYVRSEQMRVEAEAARDLAIIGSQLDKDIRDLVEILQSVGSVGDPDPQAMSSLADTAAQALASYSGELGVLPSGNAAMVPVLGHPMSLSAEMLGVLRRWPADHSGPYISGIIAEPTSHDRRLVVAVPSKGVEGRPMLVFFLDPSHVDKLLEAMGPINPFQARVFDGTGRLIAQMPGKSTLSDGPATEARVPPGSSGEISDHYSDGTPIHARFQRSDLSGWIVRTSFKTAVLSASIWRTVDVFATFVLVLAMTASPIAFFASQRIQSAIRAATAAAENMGRGQQISQSPTAIAEIDLVIGAMAKASKQLHAQSERLRRANSELETRIEQRTRDLEASHAFSNVVLQSGLDCITVLGADGGILFANRAFTAVFEVDSANAVIGTQLVDLWAAETRAAADLAFAAARRGEAPRFTARRIGRQGEDQWFDVLMTPLHGDGAAAARILAISRDMTVQHSQEDELRRSKQRAEDAVVAKTDFVADVCHELRAPLSAILGYIDLLAADDRLDETQREKMICIEKASLVLTTLAQDMLDLAQIESGEITIEQQPFSLQQVVAEAHAMVTPSAGVKHLQILAIVDDAIPPVLLGSATRLRQILLNFLGNAIKFTPSGLITLEAKLERTTADHCVGGVSVVDTGIGISAEQIPLLFRRFSQNDVLSVAQARGVGLGLALSKRLVERMHGSVIVTSQPGVGSKFSITIPFGIVAAPGPTGAAVPHGPTAFDARVLVVDDAEVSQMATRALLERLGCEVDVVETGESAIAAVRRRAYDLVLMDEQMSGMTGSQAARVIRKLDHPMNAVPIVACSGHVQSLEEHRFKAAGMNGQINKPTRLDGLAATLRQYLPARRSPDTAAASDIASQPVLSWVESDQVRRMVGYATDELADMASLDFEGTNVTALARRAHALLSTACVIDRPQLARACQAFEEAVLQGCREDVSFAALQVEVKATMAELDSIDQRNKS